MIHQTTHKSVHFEDTNIKIDFTQKILGSESMMLQAELLVAKDFDEQMRSTGDHIRFLGNIKKSYREKINNVQNFLEQNANTSRKDGKKYVTASFAQAADLYNNMSELEYDLENMTVTEKGLTLNDNGDAHHLDDIATLANGKMNTKEIAQAFATGAKITDAKSALQYAQNFGSDNTDLPFYFGHINNKDESGFPKFAIYTEPLSNMTEQLKNKLTDVEEDGEKLSVTLNQINAQRKAVLDGLNQLVNKMEQVRSNALSKMS